MACVPPCPTGSIDNWRTMPRRKAYSSEAEQLAGTALPDELPAELSRWAVGESGEAVEEPSAQATPARNPGRAPRSAASQYGATLPPWSAAHAYTNLYGPRRPRKHVTATVTGNVRVTEVGKEYDTHHVVLDFGSMPFPVLEGQSIGIVPPAPTPTAAPHHPRQYSVASPRNGERPGYNNVSLTIKRVLEDHQGQPVRGVASNYMCDLKVGDKVQVIGPFGTSFLMPNHPKSHIVMICTGTGSAPMRAMTEWRRRLRASRASLRRQADAVLRRTHAARGVAVLRPAAELAQGLSSTSTSPSAAPPGQPKKYVQDAMRERSRRPGTRC